MQNLISVPITNKYTPSSRGITLRETALRFLPTTHPAFKDPPKVGQGYPFDMLQNSVLHPRKPGYTAAVASDKSSSFIISPTEMVLIDSSNIAKVDDNFIQQSTSMAKKSLG